ncbi:MAG: NepR family anti-sigma factor [Aestuariivirga sp.]
MKTPLPNRTKTPSRPQKGENSVEDAISSELKSFYSKLEKQEIPAQFLDLLNKLDKKTSSDKG